MIERDASDKKPTGEAQEEWLVRNVKAMRERLGLTQADLAKRMNSLNWHNFHPTTISRIEKGERPVRVSEAHALAEALETDMGHMFDSDEVQMSVALAYRAGRQMREAEISILDGLASWRMGQIAAAKYLNEHANEELAGISPELATEYASVVQDLRRRVDESQLSFMTRLAEDVYIPDPARVESDG